MRRLAWLGLAPALLAGPALAQHDPHTGHDMAGHEMPGMDMSDPHAGHGDMQPVQPVQPGDASPPPVATDRAADPVFGTQAMDAARRQLRLEHGGMRYSKVMIDEAELRPSSKGDAFAWEGEGSFGGDINRFVLRSRGEVERGDVHQAEVQALYARAIDPYFNLELGVRQDVQPRPRRTYAALGVSGVAPYWFEVAATAFVSDEGDVSARLEGSYDLRLTQKLIAAPKLELNLNAQDVPELGLGSGLSTVEAGLRLRYEIRPEFAPYIGVFHERSVGDTAEFARAVGEDVRDTRFVAGIRAWF
jgi:copper resistance protein B